MKKIEKSRKEYEKSIKKISNIRDKMVKAVSNGCSDKSIANGIVIADKILKRESASNRGILTVKDIKFITNSFKKIYSTLKLIYTLSKKKKEYKKEYKNDGYANSKAFYRYKGALKEYKTLASTINRFILKEGVKFNSEPENIKNVGSLINLFLMSIDAQKSSSILDFDSIYDVDDKTNKINKKKNELGNLFSSVFGSDKLADLIKEEVIKFEEDDNDALGIVVDMLKYNTLDTYKDKFDYLKDLVIAGMENQIYSEKELNSLVKKLIGISDEKTKNKKGK